MTPAERNAIRRRAAAARASRVAAGFPERIEDIATAGMLAGRLSAPSRNTREVILSGRCGTCGYPLDGPPGVGHDIACGLSS